MEEINQKVAHAPFGCDVWELCCSPNSGLTQACLDVGLRAERYTIENGFDLKKRAVGVALATKAKEVKVRKAWGSPPCTDFFGNVEPHSKREFPEELATQKIGDTIDREERCPDIQTGDTRWRRYLL